MEDRNYGKDFLGCGIHFPPRPDPVTGVLRMSGYEEDIKEAIRIILMTRRGERVMRPEFGCGIHDFAFSTMDYATLSQIEKSVKDALILWEPRIRDVEVDAKIGRGEGVLDISISYVVRTTNNPYNLVFPFYISEGMEL